MRKYYLLAPGPTPVPPETLSAMANPVIHHRTPEFEAVVAEVKGALKELFMTNNDVIIMASSGTGGMEAAVSNFLCRGDKAIVVQSGKFGARWAEICSAFGVNPIIIDVEWGKAVEPEAIANILKREKGVKAVYTQASETSTCVVHPIREIGAIVGQHDNTIMVVDGITGIGVFPVLSDEWELDVVVTGSQKALMLPPGLALISVSEKAWRLAKDSDLPKYYFDLAKERKNLNKNTTAYTPAVSLVIGLRESLRRMKEEGLDNVFARTDRMARAARAAAPAMGLELLAPESPSNCGTAYKVPEGIDGTLLCNTLNEKYAVTLAGGQDSLKGKIFRIAHMGFIEPFDLLIGISAVEAGLKDMGHPIELGKGVAAAQAILWEK